MTGLEVGKTYMDGWGASHTVGGITNVNPDWVWTLQGDWYRQGDGRRIHTKLVDLAKPNGPSRHVVAEKPSNWDLRIS